MVKLSVVAVAAWLVIPALLAQQPPRLLLSQLTWFSRSGTRLGTLGPLADHGNLELSPDGTRVAVAVLERARTTRDLWIYEVGSGKREQFTSGPADENWLVWSPDGRRAVFNSFADTRLDLFEAPSMGDGSRRSLLSDAIGKWPVSWSNDGRHLLYVTNSRETSNDVWVLPLDTTERRYPLFQTEASENWAAFSPDGRFVAFSSTESGQIEVYVTPFPPTGRRWRVSADGGSQARWRRDGTEIFYLAPDRTLVAVSVAISGSDLVVKGFEPLFTLAYPYGAYHAFDVTADATRFLVNTTVVSPGAPAVVAVR